MHSVCISNRFIMFHVCRDNSCSSDNECGLNEYCALSINLVRGQCRTLLRDGSYCARNEDCLSRLCSGGVCTSCTQDAHCPNGHYCSNKYLPLVEKACTNFCGQLCFLSATCGGQCTTCNWDFTCSWHYWHQCPFNIRLLKKGCWWKMEQKMSQISLLELHKSL